MQLVINGEIVEDAVIRAEASALRPRYDEMVQGQDPVAKEMQLREWSRENVIERVLLRQEASRDRTPLPPDVTGDAEVSYRLDRLIERVTGKVPRLKHKDVVDYYRRNQEQFQTPEMVGVSHIVRNVDENNTEELARGTIAKALEELQNGANFAETADKYSDCPGSGGDLGYVVRGQMVEEFEKIVFALPIGGVSDVFRTVFGFHIAIVRDRKPAGVASLAEVREHIEGALHREKRERAMEDFVDALKAKAVIQNARSR